jgi:metal-sulfur cluster biosynthetic enzyme
VSPTREQILEALKGVFDPEIPVDIVNLGLVYHVAVNAGWVTVRMTMTSPGCPAGDYLVGEVKRTIAELPGVEEVDVELVWDPRWTPELMSEEGKRTLGWS